MDVGTPESLNTRPCVAEGLPIRMSNASTTITPAAAPESAWAPLRSRVFAIVWTATLIGNIGTWMRDVGAGWLMTSLSASATAVALVQVATTLPIFLLSLPAGALADILDRRRLLLIVYVLMVLVALVLGVVTHLGLMTPALLVAGLGIAGVGVALTQPVQQSLTPLLVKRPQLRSAIALNSLGVNVSRAIGPAVGGAVVASFGVAVTFYANALSYLMVIAVYWWWKGASTPASSGTPEQLGSAMRAGLRFALHAPALQRTLLRAGSFFLFASAYWALLPLIARRELGGGPTFYGVLLTCVGAGAVAGAIALPKLRERVSGESTMRIGVVLSVAVLVVLATVREQALAAAAMAMAGAAWIAVLTTANVVAQTNLPNWVRGRGLAIYLTVFYGAMTLGSLLWGQVADQTSIPVALLAAAALGVLAFLVALWKPLPELEPDLTPSMHWPEPAMAPEMADSLAQDRGPVLITVEYRVAVRDVPDFMAALNAFSKERLRDGAFHWGVYEDAAQPGRFVESFLVPSWQEHERQHHRVSRADADLQDQVRQFHQGPDLPLVQHFIAPRPVTPGAKN